MTFRPSSQAATCRHPQYKLHKVTFSSERQPVKLRVFRDDWLTFLRQNFEITEKFIKKFNHLK